MSSPGTATTPPGPAAQGSGRRLPEPLSAAAARLRTISEPWWVVIATVCFFAVTVWWLTQDNRVPDFDEGNHLLYAIGIRSEVLNGNLTSWFNEFTAYPPLVHVVGAVGLLIAGLHESAVILADNIFFLPLLAGGCYVAGNAAYGRRAGLLAALFALGSPMLVSEMREYYVDPGEAALVAASVGAILASRRFERVGIAALAGVICALGALTKQTYPLFVGGLVLVVILRGGWRHWRGLIAFLVPGAALGLPWYIKHYDQLSGLLSGATSSGVGAGNASSAGGIAPPRYSQTNVAWYFWNLINHELLLPLTLFFLVGTAVALWRFARTRSPSDYTPELFVGGLVGYLGVTYITLKDPRYSLPALVYLAVLGTGWLMSTPKRWRRWLVGFFSLVVAANFAMVSFGWGSSLTLTLPGAPPATVAGAREITFFSPGGYLRGKPVRDGDVLGLMRALKRMGFRHVLFDGGSANIPDFNFNGLGVLTRESGLPELSSQNLGLLTNHDVFLVRHYLAPGDPPPCQRLDDGSGLYVEVGNPLAAPFDAYKFVCPGRTPAYYHRTAPLPESITHNITGKPRQIVLGLFRALLAHGIRGIQLDPSLSDSNSIDVPGLSVLATGVHLPSLPYSPATNGANDGFLLLHVPGNGDAPPCVRLPDGSGLYIVRGNALAAFNDYTFYCPLPKPHTYHRAAG
jgi:4-amino-4-deoxy-L-arabinose transferase-like glycosyltransferase